jgi:hypothetical protein
LKSLLAGDPEKAALLDSRSIALKNAQNADVSAIGVDASEAAFPRDECDEDETESEL